MAIDSWAVDFGLLGKNGELLGNPYHYRDHQTDHVMEKVLIVRSGERIFSSGQAFSFLQFNTIFQFALL